MYAPRSDLAVRGLRTGLVVYGDSLGLCQADPDSGDVHRLLTWRRRPDELTLIRQRDSLRGYLRRGSRLSVVCLGDTALVRHVDCASDAPWTYLLHCRVGSSLSPGQSSLLTAFMTRTGIIQLRDTTVPGAVGGGLSLATLTAFPAEGVVLRAGLGKLLGRYTEDSGLEVEVETSDGQAVLRVSADGVTLGEPDRLGPGLPHAAWLAPERLGRRLGLPTASVRVLRGGRFWGDESWALAPRPLDYLGGLAPSLGSAAGAFVAHGERKAFVGVLLKGQVDVAVVEDVFVHITHNRLWAFASAPVPSTPYARFTHVSDLDTVDRFECVSGAAAMLTTMATAAFVRGVRVSVVVQHVSADMEVIDTALQEIRLDESPVNVSLSPIIGPHMARSQILVIQLAQVIRFHRCDLQRGLEFMWCADVTLPYIAESLCWRQEGGVLNTFHHLIGLGPQSKQSKRLTLLTQHGFQVDYCDIPTIPNVAYGGDSDSDEGQEVALDCTFADDEVSAFLASVKAERLVTPAGRAVDGKAGRQPSSKTPPTPPSVRTFRNEQATLADEARAPLQLPPQLGALAQEIRGRTLTSQEAYAVFERVAPFVDEEATEELTRFVSGGSLWMPLLRLDPLQAREPDVSACLCGLSRLIRVNDDDECIKAREVIRFVFQQ
ncbi:MAG: hypothetical protein KVP17_004646 [Porospora cf. gigantea B]|uniref:uncharacterized protein n=1 Tax=Porospora cf. gigantea B TaxID=2853592 RepID=UPI003571AED7|nr:MAG: hypothetical protein KVP17_004646 [Porospora cf. gigantea B]